MVQWQKVATDDLLKYESLRNSLRSIRNRQAALDAQSSTMKSVIKSSEAISGGGSAAEDKLLNAIVERERLESNYASVSVLVENIENALALLDDSEKMILDRFYLHRQAGHIERLCHDLGYEKSRVYELKDRALRHFTIAMYGVTDL